MSAGGLAFTDCETTSLDRDLLQVWEVAVITEAEDESVWHLPVDLSRADPKSLEMNGFVDRYNHWDTPAEERPALLADFAQEFARLTRGLTLVGTNPAFDERALWTLLRSNGECPLWHYRTICVSTLAAGYVSGRVRGLARAALSVPQANTLAEAGGGRVPDISQFNLDTSAAIPPWNSNDLSRAVGVDPDDFDRHSALGDVRWAKAVYEAVMGR